MRTRSEEKPVVVAVDGTSHGRAALRYGVLQARRTAHGRLLLLHVPAVPLVPAPPLIATRPVGVAGRAILEAAAAEVAVLAPELPVTTSLRDGGLVQEIARAGDAALLLVLGQGSPGRIAQFLGGSTVTGVAARAQCPMAVVPASWEGPAAAPRVLVGIGADDDHELVGRACGLARDLGARVLLLHAQPLGAVEVGRHSDARARLGRLLAQAPTDVHVSTEIAHGEIERVLLAAATAADVVLVRRSPSHRAARTAGVGLLARALLRETPCVVEVLPESDLRRTGSASLGSQRAGSVALRVVR